MSPATPALHLLPGTLVVVFLVVRGAQRSALAVPPQEFLHGLRAADAVLGFSDVLRAEHSPEELLPWAGNV